ncbi:MAG: PilZ domain-containing protein [Deltaproteobacteria bacterium]|nr:PilZ domain-containing protein [Deltaproteobacteria bacterium]
MFSIFGEIATDLEPSMERRRFNRLAIPLAVEYQFLQPETGEVHRGQGVLRDISLSGSYFHLDATAPLAPGQVLSLTIAAPLPYLDTDHTSRLKARGEVVRVDPPGGASLRAGIAINFLEGLTFSST